MTNKFRQLAATVREYRKEKFEEEALSVGEMVVLAPFIAALGFGSQKAWQAAGDWLGRKQAKGSVEKRKRAEYFQNKWRPYPLKGQDKEYYVRFLATDGRSNSQRSLQDGRRRMGVAGKGSDLDNPIRAQLASSKGPNPQYMVEVRLSKIVHASDVTDNMLKRVFKELNKRMAALRKKKSKEKAAVELPDAATAMDEINRETAFFVAEEDMLERLSRFGSAHPLTEPDRQEFYIVRPGGATIRMRIRNASVIIHAIGKYFEIECRDAKAKDMNAALDVLQTFVYTMRSAGNEFVEFVRDVPSDKDALANYIKTMRRRTPTIKNLRGKVGEFSFSLHNSALPDSVGSLTFYNHAGKSSREALNVAVKSLANF